MDRFIAKSFKKIEDYLNNSDNKKEETIDVLESLEDIKDYLVGLENEKDKSDEELKDEKNELIKRIRELKSELKNK